MSYCRTLILGAFGQDGRLLTEILKRQPLDEKILVGRTAPNGESIQGSNCRTFFGDLSDSRFLMTILKRVNPDHIYFLGGVSVNDNSISQTLHRSNYVDPVNVLLGWASNNQRCRVCIASSVLIYGANPSGKIVESSALNPESSYAEARATIFEIVSSASLPNVVLPVFSNHESHIRTSKHFFGQILYCLSKNTLYDNKNDLEQVRDWGYAKEYMEILPQIMHQKFGGPLIVSTSTAYSCATIISWFAEVCPDFQISDATQKKVLKSTAERHDISQFEYSNDLLVSVINRRVQYHGKNLVNVLVNNALPQVRRKEMV